MSRLPVGPRTVAETLWRDGRGWILLVVSLGWVLTVGTRIVYPALLPALRTEFGFGYATAGGLVSLLWGAYALLQFPGGLLADTTTHRTALVAGTALTAAGLLAVVTAPTFAAFVAATAVAGAGTGLYGPSRVAVLSNTYPDVDSTAIGVSQAAGNLGNAVLPALAGGLAAVAGWRLGLGALVVPLVAVTAGLRLFVPVGQRTRSPGVTELVAETRGVLVTRPVLLGTGLLLLVMVVFQSLTGFLPTYLVDEKGLSGSAAASAFGAFFAAAVVVQVGAGVLADRAGVRPTVVLSAAASLLGLAVLFVAEGVLTLLVGLVLLSCLLGCFPPAHAYTVDTVPASVQGTGYGLVRTVYIGFGATGPVLTGVVAEAVSLPEAVLALSVPVVGIVAVGWLLPARS